MFCFWLTRSLSADSTSSTENGLLQEELENGCYNKWSTAELEGYKRWTKWL